MLMCFRGPGYETKCIPSPTECEWECAKSGTYSVLGRTVESLTESGSISARTAVVPVVHLFHLSSYSWHPPHYLLLYSPRSPFTPHFYSMLNSRFTLRAQ